MIWTHVPRGSLALALCLSLVPLPQIAAAQDPATMTAEQKLTRAKQLYAEGDQALTAGDAATALAKFEEAYDTYAPDLHVFNFNIGLAAKQLDDCAKAKRAFERFLDLVPKHKARKDVQEHLLEIERSGCAEASVEPAPAAPRGSAANPGLDNFDAPVLRRTPRGGEDSEPPPEPPTGPRRGKLVAGAVLTGLGAAGLIGGAVSLGVARRRANELASLSSPGSTGFPAGDYSDDEVSTLDQRGLPAANGASVGLFVGGGVLAAVGVTLIILDRTGKGRVSDNNARREGPRLTGLGPAVLRSGAGASATLRF